MQAPSLVIYSEFVGIGDSSCLLKVAAATTDTITTVSLQTSNERQYKNIDLKNKIGKKRN